MVKSTEDYIHKHPKWEQELLSLRELLLSTDLEETIKWDAPAYTINGKNVLGLAAFKNHLAIWFFHGALLKNNTSLLYNAQEGKTQAMRQIRFEKGDRIDLQLINKYVQEAIENARKGKTVKIIRPKAIIPTQLEAAFEEDRELEEAFNALTPGRQREYADYISTAKREETKKNRLEKIIPLIRAGKGLNDRYK